MSHVGRRITVGSHLALASLWFCDVLGSDVGQALSIGRVLRGYARCLRRSSCIRALLCLDLPACLPAWPVCLPVCLSVYLSVGLFIRLSVGSSVGL